MDQFGNIESECYPQNYANNVDEVSQILSDILMHIIQINMKYHSGMAVVCSKWFRNKAIICWRF